MTTPPETVDEVVATSLANPAWGPKHDMATKFDRLLKFEEQAAQTPIELTAEQIALIEKFGKLGIITSDLTPVQAEALGKTRNTY
jgi:hypothetical protein